MNTFEGYGSPRFTQIPDYFLDHQMSELTGAQVKVMLYVFRRTYGFKKSFDAISYSQFVGGITGFDQGAGVSRTQLNVALKGLVEAGLLFKHDMEKSDRRGNIYELNIDGVAHFPQEIRHRGKSVSDLPPKSETDLPLSRKTALQQTESQQTEDQHTELMCALIAAGVSDVVAKALAAKAAANSRNTGYVAQWAKWIALQSDIRNPGAYLATAIERNAEPPQELFQAVSGQAGAYGWGGAERARREARLK